MDFRILGPLEVFSEGRDVAPGRAKTRALLALLLVNANTRVPTERIVDSLWGDAKDPFNKRAYAPGWIASTAVRASK